MTIGRTVYVLSRISIVLAMTFATLSVGWFTAADAHTTKKNWQQRKHVQTRARGVMGSPYSYGGASPSGFDCSGFTMWVLNGHGADLPHRAASQFALAGVGEYRRVWKQERLKKGDLVFFKTTSARVGHNGIYLSGGRFIHSSSSSGVRIDSVNDPYYYGPRFVGAVRIPTLRKGA
ncbi:hypothetical protein BH24ACT26_BH24ACT26_22730 [soil metagenome]